MKAHIVPFLAALIVTALTLTIPVYAGGINGDEAAIISIVQGQFEKDGIIYEVDSSYVSSAIAYLNQDSVDLTPEQCREVINEIYSNIQTGVESGYLVAVSSPEPAAQTNAPSQSIEEEGSQPEETTNLNEETSIGDDEKTVIETPAQTVSATVSPIISILELVPTTNAFEYDNVYRDTNLLMQSASIPKETIFLLLGLIGVIVGGSTFVSIKESLFVHHKRKAHSLKKSNTKGDWEDE